MNLDISPALMFILLVFATFRVSWMLSREDGMFGMFTRLQMRLGKFANEKKQYGWAWSLSELIHCPLCLGVWIAGMLVIILVTFPAIMIKIILLWLAVAGAQTFLTLLILNQED